MNLYVLGGLFLFLAVVGFWLYRRGQDSRDAQKGKQNAKTTERVVKAREKAVTNKSDLSERLRKRSG